VLDLIAQGADVALVLAFVAGILPETAIRVVQDYLRSFLRRRGDLGALTDRHPLTNLDEIDIYDRARLVDEGVNNVEALAHHDVIDLMLQTRIPAPRLVDWLDQAILYLHVGGYGGAEDRSRRTALDRLGRYGIRTATDLEGAVAAAIERDKLGKSDHDSLASLLRILPGSEGSPHPVRVILDVMDDEEWMHNLRCWRAFPQLGDQCAATPPRRAERDRSGGSRAPRAGFEPAAYSLGGSRSIQLSYRGVLNPSVIVRTRPRLSSAAEAAVRRGREQRRDLRTRKCAGTGSSAQGTG
jgi:hypothetical protein